MENLKVKAWPFLVSRNSQLDYWPLVVPPSFLAKPLPSTLAKAVTVNQTPTPPDCAIYREIHNLPDGDVTLVFRVLQAERSFVDLPGTDLLRDQSRRPIKIFEGIALEGLIPHIMITKKDFQIIHESIKPVYKDFWTAGDKRPPLKSLPFFFLSSDSATSACLALLVKAPLVMQPESVLVDSAPQSFSTTPQRIEDSDQILPLLPQSSKREQRHQRIMALIGISLLFFVIIVIILIKLALR